MTPVVLQREQTPQGIQTPTAQVTEQTVRKMCDHIRVAQFDPLLQTTAQRIRSSASRESSDCLAAIWFWVKHNVRFVHDDVLTRQLLNEPDHFELLIAPDLLVRAIAGMPVYFQGKRLKAEGDCDDFTMLALALAMAAGFDVGIVTLACDRRRPGEYSHVYGCATLPGVLVPLDCSHGKHPGWEVPRHDVQRKTLWSMDAKIISDEAGPAADPSAGSSDGGSGLGQVPPGIPSLPGMPAPISTGIPFIGTIDFQNPLEWATLGGAAASLLLATAPTSKIVGVAGFLTVRYMLQQMWGTW